MRIWDFTEYRPYLMEKLGQDGSRTGLRKKLAEAIPVHTTFVSQVLKGRAEFSLEQAEAINLFFEHTDDEGEYFLLLLMHERAGAERLKKRFAVKIKAMRDERLNIQKRLNVDESISLKDREKFYSSYIYGAIHVLTGLPQFGNVTELSDALKLPRPRTQEIVDFMLRLGVLIEADGRLTPGPQHIHIGNDSEMILKHHSNWRLHTVSSLQFLDRDDLHYSACLTLSRDDAFRVKESILQNLKTNVDIVSKSPEEIAYVMNLDFYKLLA